MGLSLQRLGPGRGDAISPGTQPQTFALVKVDLGTCHLLVPLDHHLHCYYVQSARHEDTNVGNLCSDAADQGDSAQGQTCSLIPQPTEQRLQSEDIEKRGQGQPCRIDRSIVKASESLHHHLRNSGSNPAVS